MKSYETTIMGVCTIGIAILIALKAIFDGDPSTNVDFTATCTAITAGIGLMRARDNNKSSEDVKLK